MATINVMNVERFVYRISLVLFIWLEQKFLRKKDYSPEKSKASCTKRETGGKSRNFHSAILLSK